MKCLEKDRGRRYETANGLALDVQRHLSGEPVAAAPPSSIYRLRKFVRRHRVGVLAGSAIVASLIIGIIGTTSGLRWALTEADRADREAREARKQAARAETVTQYIQGMLGSADPEAAPVGLNYTVHAMLDEVARDLGTQLAGQPGVEAAIRTTIGVAYRNLGDYDAADPHLSAAIRLNRQAFGPEHLSVAGALAQYARLAHDRDDYVEAEGLLRQALAMQHNLPESDSVVLGMCLKDLSDVLRHRGNLRDAEPLARDALAMARRLFGNESLEVSFSLHNLATLLRDMDNSAAAEPLYREALATQRKLLGDEHPQVATALSHLAHLLHNRGDWVAAEPLAREALAMRRKLLGDEHPGVAESLNKLGNVLLDKRESAAAEGLLREALAIRRRTLGDEDPMVVESLVNLADALQMGGQFAAAEPLLREALAMDRKRLGDEHPHVARILNNLALVLRDKGDLATAAQLLREALTMDRKVLGDEHPDVALFLSSLGSILHAKGDHAAAELSFREAVELHRKLLGEGNTHPIAEASEAVLARRAINSLNNLGMLLVSLGRTGDAEPVYREALMLARERKGDDDPQTALVLHHLAAALVDLEQRAEAETLARESIELYRAHPDWKSGEHAHAVDILVTIHEQTGRIDYAMRVRNERLEFLRRAEPRDDRALASELGPHGLFLLEHERFIEAEEILRECLSLREIVVQPDSRDYWLVPNTRSMLGHAVLALAEGRLESDPAGALERLRDAEPLVVNGYAWLSANFERINPALPLNLRTRKVREAGERVARLYDIWDAAAPGEGYAQKAAEWRQKLESQTSSPDGPTPGPSP